jgi:hypothetical protein
MVDVLMVVGGFILELVFIVATVFPGVRLFVRVARARLRQSRQPPGINARPDLSLIAAWVAFAAPIFGALIYLLIHVLANQAFR